MAITVEIGGSLAQTVVKKSQVINTSKNWTVPAALAGNTVTVTACAGGGSGCISGSSSDSNYIATGGWGGSYVTDYPIIVTAGQVLSLTVGAGGVGVSSQTGNIGGDTVIGTYLTLKGGNGGGSLQNDALNNTNYRSIGVGNGVRPYIGIVIPSTIGSSFVLPSESVNGNSCGASLLSGNYRSAYGGGAGLFGRGGDASNSGSPSGTPPANTGAGGGSCHTGIAGGGASGAILLEWEEFV